MGPHQVLCHSDTEAPLLASQFLDSEAPPQLGLLRLSVSTSFSAVGPAHSGALYFFVSQEIASRSLGFVVDDRVVSHWAGVMDAERARARLSPGAVCCVFQYTVLQGLFVTWEAWQCGAETLSSPSEVRRAAPRAATSVSSGHQLGASDVNDPAICMLF